MIITGTNPVSMKLRDY